MDQPVDTQVPAPSAPSAPPVCRAVIDVGTNSVKLLVGDVHAGQVLPLTERSLQTRLGEGFFQTRQLLPEAITRTAIAAAEFRAEADRFGARNVRLIATAAAREALNRDALLHALRHHTGLEPEVICGDTEASLAFRGVCTAPGLADAPLLVTDLGGGSTEFIVGRAGCRRFGRSLRLGAVRLFEHLRLSDPPTAAELERCRSEVDAVLAREVIPDVRSALEAETAATGIAPRYLGVGGTAVILARLQAGLARYDRERIENTPLEATALSGMVERLWSQPLARRRTIPGLPSERADIILTGAVIHERILGALHLPVLVASTRGLRFAALLDPDPLP